ncbi:MAG: tRNA 2-thiouridine(34) synthase MnmA [Desulfobacterales bacterium]|nr:tRNA 2-thiouridine(34) synthase MnmA [Desulfobacterales bacterium]
MTVAAVAISGGVDSLVSAFLLRSAGHDVIGLHFLNGFEHPPDVGAAEHPIHRIGAQLEIPIHVVDLADLFRRSVVAYFTDAYRAGRTPNPCLFCNPLIKFDQLWAHAARLGADFLATGHYARIRQSPDGHFHLLRGADPLKDQSYFLARLRPSQLARTRFPLGDLHKAETQRLATAHGLHPVSSGESQDVCFIREQTYGRFLEDYAGLAPSPGPIVDTDGREIGRHQGLHLFTVGQRRGIDCPAAAPYYVIRIEPEENRLVVGFQEALERRECEVEAVNWINPPPRFPADVRVKIRYRHSAQAATLKPTASGQRVAVRFSAPQKAIAPGQGAVFYDGDEVLGGGWIASP